MYYLLIFNYVIIYVLLIHILVTLFYIFHKKYFLFLSFIQNILFFVAKRYDYYFW